MQLFEIIRWGNASDDPLTGGPDGLDTCFLVRAQSLEQAAQLVDAQLARQPAGRVRAYAQLAYLLGDAAGVQTGAGVLRGPYVQSAYNHGWRQWERDDALGEWRERR